MNTTFHEFLLERYPEYIEVVPKHWLELGQPKPDVQLYISIILLVVCIPGNISQILVFLAYARNRQLRSASNRLLMSLLFADFILLYNCYLSVYQSLKGFPIFGIHGCKIYGFVSSSAALAEIWSLASISFDRFLTILYPLNTQKRIKRSQANVIVIFVWTTSVIFSVFPLIGWNKYVSEVRKTLI